MAGCQGKVVYSDSYGLADVGAGTPLAENAIFRLYSMTKPITCVAAMVCYERLQYMMDDLVEKYIPEFANMTVYLGGDADDPQLELARSKLTVHHLFTHCGGLTR